jgi:hypothetical protein
MTQKVDWLSSTEVRRLLKISSCELMHRREAGSLIYKKVGNAYFYQMNPNIESVKAESDAKAFPN